MQERTRRAAHSADGACWGFTLPAWAFLTVLTAWVEAAREVRKASWDVAQLVNTYMSLCLVHLWGAWCPRESILTIPSAPFGNINI